MNYTKSVGNINELQCISKFMEMGFDCSIPYGDCCKYDFIADVGDSLLKIKCKKCYNPKKKNGEIDYDSIVVPTSKQRVRKKKIKNYEYKESEVDYFSTYYKGNVYLIPIWYAKKITTLRLKNNGNKKIENFAEYFLIEKILGEKQNEIFLKQKENCSNNIEIKKENNIKEFYCKICGKNKVSSIGNMCKECCHKKSMVIERPEREELKNMIRNMNFLSIGKMFGVSDNAIRKWCKKENLPYKSSEIKLYSDEEWQLL